MEKTIPIQHLRSPLLELEKTQKIRREAFRTIILFFETDIGKSPPFEDVASYISDLSPECLIPTPRPGYMTIDEKTVEALNEILSKHNNIFIDGIRELSLFVNGVLKENGLREMVIPANDLRPVFIRDVEIMHRQNDHRHPLWSSIKEGFNGLRAPVITIMSIAMVGYLIGENVRQLIINAISSQGAGVRMLLVTGLIAYGMHCGLAKYKLLLHEQRLTRDESTYLTRKSVTTALQRTLSDQFRLYKTALEKAIAAP